MTEQGKVVETKGNFAFVEINKKTECDKCGMCAFPKNASTIKLRAENKISAKVGDTVILEREEKGKLLGTLLVFLVPLILIAISAIIGYLLIESEIWILILSVISIALWYTILAIIDKKISNLNGFKSKIVQVIEDKGDNKHE